MKYTHYKEGIFLKRGQDRGVLRKEGEEKSVKTRRLYGGEVFKGGTF